MRSDKPPGPYTIEQMADDAEGLLDVLRIERAVVVGYSMGGRTALSLALGHSTRVRRLVLAATSASTPPSRILSRRWLALEVLSRLPTPGERQPRWAWECQRRASASYDATARLGEIVVPTLILHGRRDHDASRTGAWDARGDRRICLGGGSRWAYLARHPRASPLREGVGGLRSELRDTSVPRSFPKSRCSGFAGWRESPTTRACQCCRPRPRWASCGQRSVCNYPARPCVAVCTGATSSPGGARRISSTGLGRERNGASTVRFDRPCRGGPWGSWFSTSGLGLTVHGSPVTGCPGRGSPGRRR